MQDKRLALGFFYLLDATGSVVGMTDGSQGNVAQTYGYDPYGDVTSQSGGLTQPYRFASGYLDSSTNYLKFGARYDDPTLGRWTQLDSMGGSLGNSSSLCRYLYAQDDPVNLPDSGQ